MVCSIWGGGPFFTEQHFERLNQKVLKYLKISNKVYNHWHLDKVSNHITKLKCNTYTSFRKKCCNFNITMQYIFLFRLEIIAKEC